MELLEERVSWRQLTSRLPVPLYSVIKVLVVLVGMASVLIALLLIIKFCCGRSQRTPGCGPRAPAAEQLLRCDYLGTTDCSRYLPSLQPISWHSTPVPSEAWLQKQRFLQVEFPQRAIHQRRE